MNQDNLTNTEEIDEMEKTNRFKFPIQNFSYEDLFDPLSDSDISCNYYYENSSSKRYNDISLILVTMLL